MIKDEQIFNAVSTNFINLIQAKFDLEKITNKAIIFNYHRTLIELISHVVGRLDDLVCSTSVNVDRNNYTVSMDFWRKDPWKNYNVSMIFNEDKIEMNIKYLEALKS